jgi:hypothetical protein
MRIAQKDLSDKIIKERYIAPVAKVFGSEGVCLDIYYLVLKTQNWEIISNDAESSLVNLLDTHLFNATGPGFIESEYCNLEALDEVRSLLREKNIANDDQRHWKPLRSYYLMLLSGHFDRIKNCPNPPAFVPLPCGFYAQPTHLWVKPMPEGQIGNATIYFNLINNVFGLYNAPKDNIELKKRWLKMTSEVGLEGRFEFAENSDWKEWG